ncbi:hypothetical protein ACFX11_036845 [Malus domestica]
MLYPHGHNCFEHPHGQNCFCSKPSHLFEYSQSPTSSHLPIATRDALGTVRFIHPIPYWHCSGFPSCSNSRGCRVQTTTTDQASTTASNYTVAILSSFDQ